MIGEALQTVAEEDRAAVLRMFGAMNQQPRPRRTTQGEVVKAVQAEHGVVTSKTLALAAGVTRLAANQYLYVQTKLGRMVRVARGRYELKAD